VKLAATRQPDGVLLEWTGGLEAEEYVVHRGPVSFRVPGSPYLDLEAPNEPTDYRVEALYVETISNRVTI